MESATNTITGAVPGVTLTLKAVGAPEDLEIAVDQAGSASRLKAFVDAIKNVNDRIDALTSNTTTSEGVLAADSSLRSIKEQIKRVITKTVEGSSTIKNLGDIGLSHTMYGSLTVDYTKFQKALAADPIAVNNLFSQATTGISAAIKPIVENATKASTGTLRTRQDSLNKTIRRYDEQIDRMNKSAENYRNQLTQQFSAMESTMSSMKAMSNYLSQQQAALAAGKK